MIINNNDDNNSNKKKKKKNDNNQKKKNSDDDNNSNNNNIYIYIYVYIYSYIIWYTTDIILDNWCCQLKPRQYISLFSFIPQVEHPETGFQAVHIWLQSVTETGASTPELPMILPRISYIYIYTAVCVCVCVCMCVYTTVLYVGNSLGLWYGAMRQPVVRHPTY